MVKMNLFYRTLERIRPWMPGPAKSLARRFVSFNRFDLERRRAANPLKNHEGQEYLNSRFRLAVLAEPSQYHQHFVAACVELQVSFRVIDLMADDWIDRLNNAKVDGVLVWPGSHSVAIKSLFDSRLKEIEDMGYSLYPSWQECWLTENKARMRDWLLANNTPHPKTWVFSDRETALNSVKNLEFPLVIKTAQGASGKGIRIVRSEREFRRLARMAFDKGLPLNGFDRQERQRGLLLVQTYLEGVSEWRMVRIGDSFFGHRKGTSTKGLHSGAKYCDWLDPGKARLDLLYGVTEKGGFRSMDVDIFETKDGKLLVNELQTVFGCSVATTQMKVNGTPGRYLYRDGQWCFEAGEYCQNHVCNLRVQWLLDQLSKRH